MVKLLWALTIIGCLIGAFFLIIGLSSATSAIQEAGAAATSIAFAVIPYCLARAVSEMGKANQ